MSNAGGSHPHVLKAFVVGGLSTVLVATGLVAHSASADSTPQRVLQAVNVDLGADGTLYGIKGVTVRKEDDGKTSTDKADYDPTKTAEDLPIRVQTSYRTAKKSGTDLTDLKGYDGRVQIDVTVQNTTVRPQRLSYDAGGDNRSAYALVGVPLTVVASTNLGDDTVDRVVTKSDSGATTNGVLTQDKDGHGVVQWASLLAPPQLAPSTTFTLVMDAKDFRLPSLDLSVQSGLNADPSMKALLDSAFGSDSSQQLKLQTQTIELIGQVTGVLAQANNQLGDVRKQLNFSAGELGDRTIESLTTGTERLSSSTEQLSQSFSRLSDSLSSSLNQTQDKTIAALDKTVRQVQSKLGDHKDTKIPKVVTSGSGCTTAVALKPQKNPTVQQQLNRVVALLNGMSNSTGTCRDAITSSLTSTIGVADEDCSTGSTSALCTLKGVEGAVADVSNRLSGQLQAAAGQLNGVAIDPASVTALKDTLVQMQTLGSQINSSSGGTVDGGFLGQLLLNLGGLAGLAQNLITPPAGTSTQFTALGAEIDRIHGIAVSKSDAAHDGFTQLTAVKTFVCDPNNPTPPPDTVLAAIDGKACDNTTPVGDGSITSLSSLLSAQESAWNDVEASTTGQGTAKKALSDTQGSIQDIVDDLAEVNGDHGDGSATKEKVDALQLALSNLYNPTLVLPTNPVESDCAALVNPGNKLLCSIATVGTRVGSAQSLLTVDTKVGTDQKSLQDTLDGFAGGVGAAGTQLGASRDNAIGGVNSQLGASSSAILTYAATVMSEGTSAVRGANKSLTDSKKGTAKVLSTAIGSSVKEVDTSVSASTRDLQGASKLLGTDLANVLKDLGTRDKKGSGLLGIVQAQAQQTRTSNTRVAAAGEAASSFGNVRSQDVDGIFLQSAQLAAALDQQAQQAPFAIKLPKGSQHVTVYAFHMREVK